MNQKRKKLPVNYSIQNIVDSMLYDNPVAKSYPNPKKKKLYKKRLDSLSKYPEIKKILSASHIRSYPFKGASFFARIGVLPPELVVADRRVKDLCTLPYWTVYKDEKGKEYRNFGKCPGYGRLPCCPPNSPKVEQVQDIINRSDFFIVLQTSLQSERWNTQWKFQVLHQLVKDIRNILGKTSVTGIFGSGPCGACAGQSCLQNRGCTSPKLKTPALESLGICVQQLCDDLALVTGQKAWKITWLKHFGLPQQTPKKWKYVEAISLKLP